MRVIVAGRLSRKADDRDQTGFDSQERESVRWAEANGHQVVAVVADYKSGRSGLEARKHLKPWVVEADKLDQYDAIVALKVDRLTRGDREETTKLEQWARDHYKQLVIVGAGVHFPSEGNEGVHWDVMLRMAHQEWLNTSERYKRMQRYLASNGYLVGRIPFGFTAVPKDSHKTLAPDLVTGPIVRRMAERYLAGNSLLAIARWLDAEGVKPVQGGTWDPVSVSQVLRNESLIGRRWQLGKYLLRHEAIMTTSEWRELQARLDSNVRRRGPSRREPAMLSGALYCAMCKGVMHYRRTVTKRKSGAEYVWQGYRCDGTSRQPSRCGNWVPLAGIEDWVDLWFTIPARKGGSGFADTEIVETVPVPAKGHADDVAAVEAELRDLDFDAPDFAERQAALLAERARLRALGTEPARTDERPTGVKLGKHWRTLDAPGKRDYLRRAGVKVYASKADRWITGDPHKVIGALRKK